MPCCVPRCRSGYKLTKAEKVSAQDCSSSTSRVHFFKAKDNKQLSAWSRKIKRGDRQLTLKDLVCSLHFTKDVIIDSFEIKLPDGSVLKEARKRAILKAGAIPSVFPAYPKYLNTGEQVERLRQNRKRQPLVVANKSSPKKVKRNSSPSLSVAGTPNTVQEAHSPLTSETTCDDFTATADDVQTNLTYAQLIECVKKLKLENKWEYFISSNVKSIFFLYILPTETAIFQKKVVISDSLLPKVYIRDKEILIEGVKKIENENEILPLLRLVSNMKACPGLSSLHQTCRGFVDRRAALCAPCRQKQRTGLKNRSAQVRKPLKAIRRKCRSLEKKVVQLSEHVKNLKLSCSLNNAEAVIKGIEGLSIDENLNDGIKTTIMAAKKSKYGMRYSQRWIYECILLKIKSRKTYKYLRRRKLMALPSTETIRRYIRKLKPAYGFQSGIFSMLKEKGEKMNDKEKEGCLILDEMAVRETYAFDKSTYKFLGFTDLGKYTPLDQQDKLGNHALVLMYQPFSGDWVQSIGCFLSRGAASGTVLHQIVTEAIILLENSGFKVNAVTTDGASWNRTMWSKFNANMTVPYCEHIVDSSRRLYFCSDFPHLIKNLRNWVGSQREFECPDGIVRLECWDLLLQKQLGFGLKAAYKLTQVHVHPSKFQKMNVGLAFQFFDETVAEAMEEHQIPDCAATCRFIRRISRLIKAMTSRTPKGALRGSRVKCTEREDVEEFYQYLNEWEQMFPVHPGTKRERPFGFLTDNTFTGLMVTLKNTLSILEYLTSERNFVYLMTSRLSQDNLERFFGMIRNSGGNDDHPDSMKFLYVYKLLSSYSLLKTHHGSNVCDGGEMLTTFTDSMNNNVLLSHPDNSAERRSFQEIMDAALVEGKLDFQHVSQDNFLSNFQKEFISTLEYLTGYVARQAQRFTKCTDCMDSLKGETVKGELLKKRDKFGVLTVPSIGLVNLLAVLESTITSIVKNVDNVGPNTFFDVCSAIDSVMYQWHSVGCIVHEDQLTLQITQFFLIMRMNFIVREARRELTARKKSRGLRKMAKLES